MKNETSKNRDLENLTAHFSSEAKDVILLKTDYGEQGICGGSSVTFGATSLAFLSLPINNALFNPKDPFTISEETIPIPFLFGGLDITKRKRLASPCWRLHDEFTRNGAGAIDSFVQLTGRSGNGGDPIIRRYLNFERILGRVLLGWNRHNETRLHIFWDRRLVTSIEEVVQMKEIVLSHWPMWIHPKDNIVTKPQSELQSKRRKKRQSSLKV